MNHHHPLEPPPSGGLERLVYILLHTFLLVSRLLATQKVSNENTTC